MLFRQAREPREGPHYEVLNINHKGLLLLLLLPSRHPDAVLPP